MTEQIGANPVTKKTKKVGKKISTKKVGGKKQSGLPTITYTGPRAVVTRQGMQFIKDVPVEMPANERLAEHKLKNFIADPDFTVD